MKTKHKSLISFISPMLGLILFGLTLLVLFTYKTKEIFGPFVYFYFGLIILLIGFGLYFKIQSYRSEKAGLTAEDELSKRIKEKAESRAFSYSVYMWLFLILPFIDVEPRDIIIICTGLIGMMLIFFLNWFYYSKVGISDENKD